MQLPLDLLYNFRLMRKHYGFVAICTLMIGLGMALSIVLYSIGDHMGVRAMPLENGDRYANVWITDTSNTTGNVVPADAYTYQSLKPSLSSFKTFGAYHDTRAIFSDGEVAERFQGAFITSNLLQAPGVIPVLGRNLSSSDDDPGAEATALISYDLWQSYYGGREDIVGHLSRINGNTRTIVGVMPDDFHYPVSQDIWMPLQLPENVVAGAGVGMRMTGILADGVNLETAKAELTTMYSVLAESESDIYGDYQASLRQCCSIFNSDGPISVQFLFSALAMSLLLLVCLNVANLILVRTIQRIHEYSIRSALGASRRSLIITVLQDSLLICLLGSLLGIILANFGLYYVGATATAVLSSLDTFPFWFHFGWEPEIAFIALLILVAIWLLSAALAIWQIVRQDLSVTLAGGVTGSTDARSAFGTATMVSVEIVFSCFLLIISGIFLGGSLDLTELDYGTNTEGYLTARIDLDTPQYQDADSRDRYRQELKQELLTRSGVDQVTFTTDPPSQSRRRLFYNLDDREVRVNGDYPRQSVIHVEGDYFQTMGVALRAGRTFESTDTRDSLPVVILDESFARQLWPEEENPAQTALGKRIQISPELPTAKWLTVVGVTPHLIQRFALDGIQETSLYLPLSQPCCSYSWQPIFPLIKVAGNPDDFGRVLQEAAMRVDRDVAISNILPLDEFLQTLNSVVIFAAEVATSIALITLVLAVTGIYAIVSRSVRQRTKEIGIRRAIGSSNTQVLWVFIKQGLKYLSLGLLIGGGSAILLSNGMNSESVDFVGWLPLVFTSVSIGLSLLVLLATYNPASQLVAMEPGETLHHE